MTRNWVSSRIEHLHHDAHDRDGARNETQVAEHLEQRVAEEVDAAVAVLVFLSFTWLGDVISRLSARATALLLRLGGLLLATIGTQMLLGRLKNFFAA